ncbi:MAG: hypothetical protein KY468_16915, partial [Armatimonadetes bacterium]|nr:hypothetical protein [Armatimonadota bacterium]
SRILPDASPEQKAKGIGDLTWDEVSRLDIGAWKGPEFEGQRVPCLADVFAMLQAQTGRRIYVDIKEIDLEQLAREAEAARVTERLILASTDHAVVRRWKALAPGSSTLHWMGGTETELARRLEELREAGFAAIDQLQIHVRKVGDSFTPSPCFLERTGRELRDREILYQVFAQNSSDSRDIFRLMDLGVASFATDYPAIVMRAIRDYYSAAD